MNEFLDLVTQWADHQTDIQLLALIGSYARGTAGPDSDIDLLVLTNVSQEYLKNPSWVNLFGEVHRFDLEDYGKITSLRAQYKNYREVEFGFGAPDWADDPDDLGARQTIQDGIWILYCRNQQILDQIERIRREFTDE